MISGAELQEAAAEGYKPGEVLVLFDSTAQFAIESTQSASEAQKAEIGIAAFDSIGTLHHLQSIQASPQARVSAFARRLFTLVFPIEAPIPLIAAQYASLPFVVSAEPNYYVHATADTSIKENVLQGSAVIAIIPTTNNADTVLVRDKEFTLRFLKNHPEVIKGALSASQTGRTITGDAVFDSIGIKNKLKAIRSATSEYGGDSKSQVFILIFPPEANLKQIAKSFNCLPYIQSAEPDKILKILVPDEKVDPTK